MHKTNSFNKAKFRQVRLRVGLNYQATPSFLCHASIPRRAHAAPQWHHTQRPNCGRRNAQPAKFSALLRANSPSVFTVDIILPFSFFIRAVAQLTLHVQPARPQRRNPKQRYCFLCQPRQRFDQIFIQASAFRGFTFDFIAFFAELLLLARFMFYLCTSMMGAWRI